MASIRRVLAFTLAVVMVSLAAAGCGASVPSATHDLAMAPMSQMPADVRAAPTVTQQAYQFAVANPDVMQQIPCYCGCGAMGHTSNYSCYVQGVAADGTVTFDSHALGCSICVDITQDTVRLLREGKSAQAIRAYVDQTYSRYGPSNMP